MTGKELKVIEHWFSKYQRYELDLENPIEIFGKLLRDLIIANEEEPDPIKSMAKNMGSGRYAKTLFMNTKNHELTCKHCKDTTSVPYWRRSFCSNECQYTFMKVNRKSKNNPNYKSGIYSKDTGSYKKGSKIQGLHLRACTKYRKEFLKKTGYAFCEVCYRSDAPRYEVHHLYYASRYPKHKELHNFKNLIHICYQCHKKFHAGELKRKFEDLEFIRGLKKLFA